MEPHRQVPARKQKASAVSHEPPTPPNHGFDQSPEPAPIIRVTPRRSRIRRHHSFESWGLVALIIASVGPLSIAALCCVWLPGRLTSEPKPKRKPASPGEVEIGLLAAPSQRLVRECLKHPHDAVFKSPPGTWLDVTSNYYGDDRYGVAGLVTAKNDFGAELTKEWEVIWTIPNYDASRAEVYRVTLDGEVMFRAD